MTACHCRKYCFVISSSRSSWRVYCLLTRRIGAFIGARNTAFTLIRLVLLIIILVNLNLLSFIVLGLVTACSAKQKTPSSSEGKRAEVKVARADSTAAEPGFVVAPNSSQVPPSQATKKTIYQLLQGKWQSTQDTSSIIELKGRLHTDIYAGKRLHTAAFILDQACPATPGAGHPSDNEKHLVVPTDGMCWEVVKVDEASLTLLYTKRGNTLNYRRMN
jgi:hypothetical protein